MNTDSAILSPNAFNLPNGGQWTQIKANVFQRPCIGQEHSASYHQNIADGHTELSEALTFSMNCSPDEVIQRAQKAWYRSRFLHPESAVELSTDFAIPQMMTYRLLLEDDKAEVEAWMQDTFVVVDDRNYQDVHYMTYNRRLPTRGKASMMYLVLDNRPDIQDEDKVHAIIWNVSHAVTDAFSIAAFLNSYCDELVDNSSIQGFLQSKKADIGSIVKHLPISPLVTYEERYNPKEAERKEALIQAKNQVELYTTKLSESVALYPESDHASRKHGTHCIYTQWSLQESKNVSKSLKQAKVGITYAGAAATILATYQLYGKGHETGALLGMTRNARRWVSTVLSDTGRTAIPMGTDVVFLWIPFAEHLEAHKNNKKELMLSIGREIKTQLSKHLKSPHYLSAVEYMSEMHVESLRAAQNQAQQQDEQRKEMIKREDVCPPSAPGFSSQGASNARPTITRGSTTLKFHEMIHAGRQVGSSPWIGLYSTDDVIKFNLGFDTKYYRVEKMTNFLNLVMTNIQSITDDDAPPNQPEMSKL